MDGAIFQNAVRRGVALLAAVVLLAGGCGDPASVEDLVATANDRDNSAPERCGAIDQLSLEGEPAVAPLHRLTQDRNPRVARCALAGLEEISGPGAAAALAGLLQDDDPAVVVSAAKALGKIGGAGVVDDLTRVLASRETAAVVAALRALGRIGDARAEPAVARVALRHGATDAAERTARSVRGVAVATLGSLGDPRARSVLVHVLATEPANATAAGTSLARIYHKDVRSLLPLLDDPDNLALAFTLVDVGQRGTEDALVAVLHRYGGVTLAEYYLNCGNKQLERAAEDWAHAHGYDVITTPGYGSGGGQWGSGA